jgi:gliding motility-associated-like protein
LILSNNKHKFTDFLNLRKHNTPNMRQSLFKFFLTVGTLLMLGAGNFAEAQCDPVVLDRDGSKVKAVTFCENEPISFQANSPGFTTTVLWDFGDGTTSNQQDPTKSYSTAGSYTVNFTSSGGAGNCTGTISVTIKRSPRINIRNVNSVIQCFEGNNFCFVDSTRPVPNSTIVRQTYVFSDGERIDTLNPTFPVNFCKKIIDPTGGYFDLTIESEDANGCVTRLFLKDNFYVNPRLGIKFDNITPGPNPGCDSTLGRYENQSEVPLSAVKRFCWYWGDGDSICGDSNTNTEWWNGPNGDGVVEHMYRDNGTFDGKLVVEASYDCVDSFVWKAAVTNFVLNPVIVADMDSSCVADNPVCFSLKDGPPAGASAWLWNFGDPPAGPANFNDQDWDPCKAYGTGPWMISLRIIAGPCDITVYDTITKIGPGSTIEVPFDRVAEGEAYQCLIEDSVRFPNNSSFYHNDPTTIDEDSIVYYYKKTWEVWRDNSTGFDSIRYREWNETKIGNRIIYEKNYPIGSTVTEGGITVRYDSGKDSLEVTQNGNTTFEPTFFGLGKKLRYAFNFQPTNGSGAGNGDQTALPPAESLRGYDPNVWRVWDFGDQYAPQCTTDSRPWMNKNVGINCNWTIDSNPVHWYTPWDEIYRTFNDGANYFNPYAKTLLHKPTRQCYQVNVYAADTMTLPARVILTIPKDSSYSYSNLSFGAGGNDTTFTQNDTLYIVRRPPSFWVGTEMYFDPDTGMYVAVNINNDTTYHDPYRLGDNNRKDGNGTTTWTVTFYDMEVDIPSGVTLEIEKLAAPGGGGANVGTTRFVTGPRKEIIEADEQFILSSKDTLFSLIYVEEIEADTQYAQASNYLADTTIFGVPTTVTKQQVYIDSAEHREEWFLENAQCFSVSLWHKDTIHPLACEGTGTKSLALIPPSAKGLEWVGGVPCPLDGPNPNYFLEFDMGETKPGCSQQWFAVNYDSLADPTNFVPFNSGGVLAPPAPGSPIPFVMPYDIVGSYGTQFVKGYTPGEIGNDPALRNPNGSFTLGLIVGNGKPDPNGGPPACLDTFWYNDMFRILYLNADFEILVPDYDPKTICAGGEAVFRINEPIQDSIRTLRWAWGYQGIGRGPNLDIYVEQFEYYQPYTGPSPTRNDKDVVYNGEDWLYNYVIRQTLTDFSGLVTVDTIVATIIKDWRVVANTRNADQAVKDAFEQLGLYYNELPPEDIPFYLGDGTFGCLDTTGLSDLFTFGIKPYSEKVDWGVFVDGDRRYRTDTTVTPWDTIEVAQILHFRDSSIQGYDTLEVDTNGDGRLDKIAGVWKKQYTYPELVTPDPCFPDQKDTVYRPSNGPMVPTLFLNNTVGCEKRGARLLNVGFLNDFWLDNENICNGLVVRLEDTLRYWQYGEQDPPTYPIFPFDFWHDPQRYLNNREIFKADWDETDGLNDFERSLSLNHIYDEPGEYTITVVSIDSLQCTDTVRVKAYITDVLPDFGFSNGFLNCNTFVDFKDSTVVVDPCALRDTCTTGIDLSCDSIIKWEWDFGDGTRKSLLQNPTHDYTQSGWFNVKLKVWTELGCLDSIVKRIYIPGPDPNFEFEKAVWNEQDSAIICVGDSVVLFNVSGGDKLNPVYEMRWGDGTVTNPGDSNTYYGHTYDKVGVFELYLIQFDEIPGTNTRCSRIFPDTNPDLVNKRKIKVIVLPRAEADMTISDTIVCPNEQITFTANVDTLYTRYVWRFGDGDTVSRFKPDSNIIHSYANSGTYRVTLIPDYTPPPFLPKCVDTAFGNVTVVDVEARFDYDSTFRPEFCFNNLSTNAVSYEWTFDDDPSPGSSTEENPCYNWGDRRGSFEVCLVAISSEGCRDTFCDEIRNTFIRRIIPYNVFTPNASDNLNTEFVVDGEGLENYNIKIFNRWGEKVFESEDINISWNGKVDNVGSECPEGTYFYVINYQFLYGEENEGLGPIEGTVELIRSE